jgi:hypothetical protein
MSEEIRCRVVRNEEPCSVMQRGEIVELWLGGNEQGDGCGILELWGDGSYRIVQRGDVFPPVLKPSTRQLIRNLRDNRIRHRFSGLDRQATVRIYKGVYGPVDRKAYIRCLVKRVPMLPLWRLDLPVRY